MSWFLRREKKKEGKLIFLVFIVWNLVLIFLNIVLIGFLVLIYGVMDKYKY